MAKEKRWTKFEVVHEADPVKFRDKLNALNEELAIYRPKTTFNITPEIYQAIIEYEMVETIPENAVEELEAQGIYFTCADCPKYEPELNMDGSVRRTSKKGKCFLSDRQCRDSIACEWFCKQYLKGEIQPVGGSK